MLNFTADDVAITLTTPDGEVVPFDDVLAQNIGRTEIGGIFNIDLPGNDTFSVVFGRGAPDLIRSVATGMTSSFRVAVSALQARVISCR